MCRWKLGIVMIVSQLFSFAVYALTALYRIWATLANANWEAGFLWRPTSPGQKLANAASLFLLKRRRVGSLPETALCVSLSPPLPPSHTQQT